MVQYEWIPLEMLRLQEVGAGRHMMQSDCLPAEIWRAWHSPQTRDCQTHSQSRWQSLWHACNKQQPFHLHLQLLFYHH